MLYWVFGMFVLLESRFRRVNQEELLKTEVEDMQRSWK